ncbi:hypothetical protein [Streptomyces mirabilis]|uniref:hypothetical protein n=1 Tax=Streptomyces mirabilis TaxID=68239 RepID=UPI003662C50A
MLDPLAESAHNLQNADHTPYAHVGEDHAVLRTRKIRGKRGMQKFPLERREVLCGVAIAQVLDEDDQPLTVLPVKRVLLQVSNQPEGNTLPTTSTAASASTRPGRAADACREMLAAVRS